MTIAILGRLSAALLVSLSLAGAALADNAPAAPQAPNPWDEAAKVQKAGPVDVALDTAVMHLPAGYTFIPQPQADAVSASLGNQPNGRLKGLVLPKGDVNWIVYIEYVGDGHVADDEAKDWNADDLLQGLKDGTEANNAFREKNGFKPVEVAGWIERPAYDAAAHRLVWSALVRDKGDTTDAGSANYNTYALGREGHFELDLVADAGAIEQYKADARAILASLDFKPGERYADFNASTDKLATYGIAALIGGAAAKKLGLLALIGVFFLKMGKLAFVAVAGVFFAVKRFVFGGRRAKVVAAPASPVVPAAPPGDTPA